MRISYLLPAALLCAATLSGLAYAQDKQVVFIAGSKDHGFPGRHEYEKDLRVLAYCLENSSNLKGVTTKFYAGKPPEDLTEIQDASLIVLEGSSDSYIREKHPLFPQDPSVNHGRYDQPTQAYLKQFNAIVKKGAGVAVFHYSLWVENWTARSYYLDWIGGIWVQTASKNPSGQWKMELKNTDHPILRGVKPWEFREEVFYNPMLVDAPRRTDLVIGHPVDVRWWGGKSEGPAVAAWAYAREGGGRGFAYGGLDFHENMNIDNVRRFVLNGLVWAAGMEVPAGGVQCTLPEGMVPPTPPMPRRFPRPPMEKKEGQQ
jgi:type 1 glutamine amidotransferase